MRVLLIGSRQLAREGTGDAKVAYWTSRALAEAGHEVSTIILQPDAIARRMAETTRALISGRPLQFGLTSSRAARRRIDELLGSARPDLIVAVHARAVAHVPASMQSRTLALLIDAYGQNYRTYAGRTSWPLQMVYRMEQRRMDRFERDVANRFARTAVVSDLDRRYLQSQAATPSLVVRLTYPVDLEFFSATKRRPQRQAPVFVFLGRLNYLPNRDAVGWLVGSIWPQLRTRWPGARLRVVGAAPSSAIRRLSAASGVELAANVADVRASFEDVTALLVPMRMGGGVQTKILEAMAARVPVISSGFAAQGLTALPEGELLIAESPADFVRQSARLIDDPEFSGKLVAEAHAWVAQHHSPELFVRDLLAACHAIVTQQPTL